MNKKNFYEILRVKTNATQSQIKKAFLKLVSKYHPDVYEGDKEFGEDYTAILTEAYSVLSDPVRRKDYDIANKINDKPSFLEQKRQKKRIEEEEDLEKQVDGKNYEQEMTRKYFKNSTAKKSNGKNLFKKIFTSKLFYILLFLFGIEMIVILFILYVK